MKHKWAVKEKRFSSSVFVVILWLNLFSIIIVSCFNYFVFHRMSNNAYLKSFLNYNSQMTDLAFKNVDRQIILPVLHIPQLYFSAIEENGDLLYPQEHEITGSASKITALASAMRRIQKQHPYVVSMDLYYEGTGTVVTGFGKVHFPETEDKKKHYIPWLSQMEQQGITRGFIRRPAAPYAVDEPVITYAAKVTQPKWQGKSIYMAVHIAQSAFGEYIQEQEGSLAVMAKDGEVIYDTLLYAEERMSAGAVMAEAGRQGVTFEEEGPPVSLNVSGDLITVFYTVSPDTGLRYLYRIADNSFYREYNATKRVFIMGYLISIGFNLLVLIMISYSNHAAYRKRVQDASRQAGIDAGQDNRSFDASLRVLTREISSLHKSIDSSKSLVFQGAIRSIILNKRRDKDSGLLKEYLSGDTVCIFLIQLSEREAGGLSVESLQQRYEPGQRRYNILFTTMDSDNLVAVLLGDGTYLKEDSEQFLKEIDEIFTDCHVAAGLPCPAGGDGVSRSYRTAAEASRYRYIYRQEKYLSYELLKPDKRKNTGSHLKLFELMEKDIKNEDFLDFKIRMEGLIYSFQNGGYTIDYCSSTLRDLVTLFYQTIQQYQMDMWVVFGYDIREHYKQIRDIDTFHQWGNDICEILLKNVQQKKNAGGIDLKDKMIRIIDENLENVSLEYLADELHMRPDAVSRMFRQIMGKGYAEYIREQKLGRAIELMDRGLNINAVAEQLGYSSAQYFIKVFKEEYGITPYQFKKNREKENRD